MPISNMIGILVIHVNIINISHLLNVLDARKNIVLNIAINAVGKDLFSSLEMEMRVERKISIL
jgi:hypothetical protein